MQQRNGVPMNAFVTGSYAYGEPTEESDIDLCVCVTGDDLEKLSRLADDDPGSGGHSLRFGDLNLICLTQRSFEAWHEATQELIAMKPVTRDKAIEVIKAKVATIQKAITAKEPVAA